MSLKGGAFAFYIKKTLDLWKVLWYVFVLQKGGATHMTTLEDLYYGNISPHKRYIKHGSRVDKLVKLI